MTKRHDNPHRTNGQGDSPSPEFELLLDRLGAMERSGVTDVRLDRISRSTALHVAAREDHTPLILRSDEPVQGTRTGTGRAWLTPLRAAAAIGLMAALGATILALRTGSADVATTQGSNVASHDNAGESPIAGSSVLDSLDAYFADADTSLASLTRDAGEFESGLDDASWLLDADGEAM